MKYHHLISDFGPTALSPSRLFRTDDFLLIVNSSGFSESYRRVYFKDIQSIQVLATRKRMYWLIGAGIGGGLLGALTIIAAVLDAPIGLLVFLATLTAVSAIFFSLNLMAGPSCRCVVHTAVQSSRLRMVNRLAKVKKLLEAITPLIEEQQGLIGAEQLPDLLVAGWKDLSKPRKVATPPPAPRPAAGDAPPSFSVPTPNDDWASVPPSSDDDAGAPSDSSVIGPDEPAVEAEP